MKKFFLNQDFTIQRGIRKPITFKKGEEIDCIGGDDDNCIGNQFTEDIRDPDDVPQYQFPWSVIDIVEYRKALHMGDIYLVKLEDLKTYLKACRDHTGHAGLDTIGKKLDCGVINLNDIDDVKAANIISNRERFGW